MPSNIMYREKEQCGIIDNKKCYINDVPTVDYEAAYTRLQHEFQELANENKDLKKALVNIALKL